MIKFMLISWALSQVLVLAFFARIGQLRTREEKRARDELAKKLHPANQ